MPHSPVYPPRRSSRARRPSSSWITRLRILSTILMVTHDREMVDKMRKRVIQLEDGRLARDERRGGYTGE